MSQVTVEEAREHLDRLIEDARNGEVVVITREDEPLVKLVAVDGERRPRRPGSAKDVILYMADDFDAPLEDFKDYM
jgi:antitoxin (DNA-binding transcriptional repressor) of toxin-antitoxin stability system